MAPTSQVNRVHNLIVRLHQLEEFVATRMGTSEVESLLQQQQQVKKKDVTSWSAILARAQDLETRMLVNEAERGVYGIAGQELMEVVRRVGLLESGAVQLPDHQRANVPDTRTRVLHALERYGIKGAHFIKVMVGGQTYYETMTLEDRAKMLGAPNANHLCKSLLMSVTGGATTTTTPSTAPPPEETFVMVIVPYNSKIDTTALRNVLRAKNFAKPGVAVRPCLATSQQAKTILGFPMNGTAPIGGFQDVPILVSHELMELNPPAIYLGGGEDDVKLYLADVHDFVRRTNAVVDKFTETRYIGKEGAMFRALSAESAPPTPEMTPVPVVDAPQVKTQPPSDSKKRVNREGPVEDMITEGGDGGSSSSDVTFNDLDVRVGHVVKCWKHPESEKLICEEIDVGEGAPRAIASGLQKHYTPDAFQGQRVLVVCNLKPAKLGGFVSNGMVLCASWQDAQTGMDIVKLIRPASDAVKIGERVVVKGVRGAISESASAAQVKKKDIFTKVAKDLLTSLDGVVQWQGKNLTMAGGSESNVVVAGENVPQGAHVT